MPKIKEEKDECVHRTINRFFVNSTHDFINLHGEVNMGDYLSWWLELLAHISYLEAPSCEAAEALFQDAINEAKERFLEE